MTRRSCNPKPSANTEDKKAKIENCMAIEQFGFIPGRKYNLRQGAVTRLERTFACYCGGKALFISADFLTRETFTPQQLADFDEITVYEKQRRGGGMAMTGAWLAENSVVQLTEDDHFLELFCKGCPEWRCCPADEINPEETFCPHMENGMEGCIKEQYLKGIEDAIREALE